MALLAGGFALLMVITVITYVVAAMKQDKRIKCRKCFGTNVSSDPYKYRGVVCHLCQDCGEIYETLR